VGGLSRGADPKVQGAALKEHERFLWGLCYRMTGSAADADDLVQETFVRALTRPPARTDEPWRPWLTRVALNLGRDLLRRRKRRAYVGPWLPAPIEAPAGEASAGPREPSPPSWEASGDEETSTEGRYDLLESVSFAFLLALEALTPMQRAVLLLRDVFDYTVREAADALGTSEANVKTSHHRARRAMEAHDRSRQVPTAAREAHTRRALERFMASIMRDDVEAVEALLSESVRVLSDGAGEYLAARVPVVGRSKVARFFLKLRHGVNARARVQWRTVNGHAALLIEREPAQPTDAPRMLVACDADPDGRITAFYWVLATKKLTAVPPIGP
jgi:RNA polymerase sigma-70 factor, ECF subfamily